MVLSAALYASNRYAWACSLIVPGILPSWLFCRRVWVVLHLAHETRARPGTRLAWAAQFFWDLCVWGWLRNIMEDELYGQLVVFAGVWCWWLFHDQSHGGRRLEGCGQCWRWTQERWCIGVSLYKSVIISIKHQLKYFSKASLIYN